MNGPRIVLHGQGPSLEGVRWEARRNLRMGRRQDLEVVLADMSVSRLHAEVLATAEGWLVRDLGSKNGTYLNGTALGEKACWLKPRDEIRCGDMAVRVAEVVEGLAADPAASPESPACLRVALQRSWSQALEWFALPEDRWPEGNRLPLARLRSGHHLCHVTAAAAMFQAILDDAVALFDARRAWIAVIENKDSPFQVCARAGYPSAASGPPTALGTTAAEDAFRASESLLWSNPPEGTHSGRTWSLAPDRASSRLCALLRSSRRRLGVLYLERGPAQPPFTQDDLFLADAVAAGTSAGIEASDALSRQRHQFLHMIAAMTQALNHRDHYLEHHAQMVATYSLMLADELHLAPDERQLLEIGAPIHDIGKIVIPEELLQKLSPLTPAEFSHVQAHTVMGSTLLEAHADLAPLVPIIRSHHERWDGRGYPEGLAGPLIPRSARIVAVADAFAAMISNRPYRPALSLDEGLCRLQEEAGTQFDPECVQAFLSIRPRIEAVYRQVHSENGFARPRTEPEPARVNDPSESWPGSDTLCLGESANGHPESRPEKRRIPDSH